MGLMSFYLVEFFIIKICWCSKTLDLYMHALLSIRVRSIRFKPLLLACKLTLLLSIFIV